jgi:hypothetical protein
MQTMRPFRDPDPFHELGFASQIAARRAIAEEIWLPLAKLSDEDRAFIDTLLARTWRAPKSSRRCANGFRRDVEEALADAHRSQAVLQPGPPADRCRLLRDGLRRERPVPDWIVHRLRTARAADAVLFQIDSHPVPAKTNPLGAKGCGEAGCAGSLPAVMNAVVDALSDYGIRHIDMPATPHRVWKAIRQARANG